MLHLERAVSIVTQTNDLKDALSQAKSLINALPGGELCLDEQDEVINMLERLKQAKKSAIVFRSSVHQDLTHFDRAQLDQLSQYVPPPSVSDGSQTDAKDTPMEIDSTASTPGA